MARIIVTTERTTRGGASVLLNESVHPVHLSTGHAAMQLIKRLGWALSDAEELERAQPQSARGDLHARTGQRRRAGARRRVAA